jgi:hypothetical protein
MCWQRLDFWRTQCVGQGKNDGRTEKLFQRTNKAGIAGKAVSEASARKTAVPRGQSGCPLERQQRPTQRAHLVADGRLFSNRGLKIVEGEPSQCHDNAFALWETKPERYMVVTGFGLSRDGIWRPHSWCVDRTTGKIIETTKERTKYFGVEFSKAEFDDVQEAIREHQKSRSQKSDSLSPPSPSHIDGVLGPMLSRQLEEKRPEESNGAVAGHYWQTVEQ